MLYLLDIEFLFALRLPTSWRQKHHKGRIITLSDQTESLDVNKLTNQYDYVTIICLTVDVYMGRVSLNSIKSTTLQAGKMSIKYTKH